MTTQAPGDERVEEIRKRHTIDDAMGPSSFDEILALARERHTDRAYLLSLFAAAPTPAPTKAEPPHTPSDLPPLSVIRASVEAALDECTGLTDLDVNLIARYAKRCLSREPTQSPWTCQRCGYQTQSCVCNDEALLRDKGAVSR